MIDEKLLKKYKLPTVEQLKTGISNPDDAELMLNYMFLDKTDYIPLKMVEGEATKEEYAEELEARRFARSEIRRLEGGEQK